MYDTKFEHYKREVEIATDKLKKAGPSEFGYIFIADLHNGAYLLPNDKGQLDHYESDELTAFKTNDRIARLESIAEIAKNNDNIDFICVGGDIINGYETGENAREVAAYQITSQLDVLTQSGKPVFVLMGNHDDGSFHRIYYPWWDQIHTDITFSDKYWFDHFLTPYIPRECVHDSEYPLSKYYYYDLVKNGKTVRVVCLDTFDARMPFDSEGNVTEWIKENVHYGYSKHQLKWLVTEALPPEFNGESIILAHMGIDTAANGYHTPGGDTLRAIISAYQNKSAFCDGEIGINADYSENKGRILSYHFGHIHKNTLNYGEDIKLWQISIDAAPHFDIILKHNKTITRINFRNGEDAKINLE